MDTSDTAVTYFSQGYNCAQSVAAAFAETFGLDTATVMKMMAGFGAGIGGTRGTCGAVSAMVLVAGLHAGGYAPVDTSRKKALYDEVKGMLREFVDIHGSTCCRELLERAACAVKPDPSQRNAAYYAARPCARYVANAATIAARAIQSHTAAAAQTDHGVARSD